MAAAAGAGLAAAAAGGCLANYRKNRENIQYQNILPMHAHQNQLIRVITIRALGVKYLSNNLNIEAPVVNNLMKK